MEIRIDKIVNNKLEKNKINIKLEANSENDNLNEFIQYIENFEKKVIVTKEKELIEIPIKEIIYFYSDKKYNYCKTAKGEFKIKSKLYELEKVSIDFLRISKSCVINVQEVKCFDLSETGKIIVRFYDGTEQFVARRKIKDIMNYLEERGI